MPKAKPTPSIGQSLLVRTLTEWGIGSKRPPPMVFSTRIADLIDISSAIKLSDFFKLLKNEKATGLAPSPDIVMQYLQHCKEIREVIDTSFEQTRDDVAAAGQSQSAGKGFLLPEATGELLNNPRGFQPYARFYSLQQSELERRTSILRRLLLAELRACSDELSRVAALDTALEPLLLNFGRRCFAVFRIYWKADLSKGVNASVNLMPSLVRLRHSLSGRARRAGLPSSTEICGGFCALRWS